LAGDAEICPAQKRAPSPTFPMWPVPAWPYPPTGEPSSTPASKAASTTCCW